MNKEKGSINEARSLINKEIKIIDEIISIDQGIKQKPGEDVKKLALSQIDLLKNYLRKTIGELSGILEDMSITKPLPKSPVNIVIETPKLPEIKEEKISAHEEVQKEKTKKHKIVDVDLTLLDRNTIKRLKKKKEIEALEKEQKASSYIRFANNIFGETSKKLGKTAFFMDLDRDLIKANLKYVIGSYISMILLTCLISFFVGILVLVFFLFFNISAEFPIFTLVDEAMLTRLAKIFWIPIAAPILTFLSMYVYPALEKSYIENRINQELPFATINMSAIAGSMLEPSKIFTILVSTKEYPFLEREFIKIINQINVYGYDFVNALRNVAFNSPSTKLTELLNGIATTINSGGDLSDFFEKRSQTLLFEYKIERDKYTKSAETFMDLYISLVIAAPMILMLLLMMMRVSNLGISLSTSMITLVMILGVGMINAIFLLFLQLKQPKA